jgi:hypothetical protein
MSYHRATSSTTSNYQPALLANIAQADASYVAVSEQ